MNNMVDIIVTDTSLNKSGVIFRNMPMDTAKIIAAHMNALNVFAAKQTGKAIKQIFEITTNVRDL